MGWPHRLNSCTISLNSSFFLPPSFASRRCPVAFRLPTIESPDCSQAKVWTLTTAGSGFRLPPLADCVHQILPIIPSISKFASQAQINWFPLYPILFVPSLTELFTFIFTIINWGTGKGKKKEANLVPDKILLISLQSISSVLFDHILFNTRVEKHDRDVSPSDCLGKVNISSFNDTLLS